MPSTTFNPGTVIPSAWLNEVNTGTFTTLPAKADSAALAASGGSALVGFQQTGTGAVATTVQSVLRERTSVFRFLTSAEITDVQSRAGTIDITAKVQAAIDAVSAAGGGILEFPTGTYRCDSGLILKRGVDAVGSGKAHQAFYANPAFAKTGTVLLVTGANGADCIKFESNVKGHFGIYNMSIFDNGSNAIRSICNISGILHPALEDVELACLNTPRGIGLLLSNETALPPFSGQALTIYGSFRNVVVSNVQDGLKIVNDSNANTFSGGSFAGTRYALWMTGTYAYPVATSFSGTAFESTFNASTQEIVYVPGASNIQGWTAQTNAYVAKFIKIEKAKGTMFSGCYFENGSTPATYNDGVNGTWNIASVVALDAATSTDVDGTDMLACSWNCFLLDKGVRTVADNLPGCSYKTVATAALVRRNTSTQAVAAFTHTAINFTGQAPIFDSAVIDYNSSTKLATFKQQGTYLVSATVQWAGFSGTADYIYLRGTVGGSIYYGPNTEKTSAAAKDIGSTLTFVVAANVGDTLLIEAYQGSAASQNISNSPDRVYLSIVKN